MGKGTFEFLKFSKMIDILKVPLHKGDQVEDKVTWSANLKVTN